MSFLQFIHLVVLNLFQHPFRHFEQALAARWMLKQVQHDALVVDDSLPGLNVVLEGF